MNWMDFLASLVDSLAWPLAMVTVLVLFRGPMAKILLALTGFRYRGIELDFGRQLSEAGDVAQAAQAEAFPEEVGAAPKERGAARELMEEVEAVAQVSPAAAIPLAWSAVESELRSAVARLGLIHNGETVSTSRLIRHLREASALDTRWFYVLDRLRRLRNVVLHGEATVWTDTASEYGELASSLIKVLEAVRSEMNG